MATAGTGGDTLARRLARQGLACRPASLSPAALDKARICLLDYLSCAFEARDLPWCRQAVGRLTALPAGTPGAANVIAASLLAAPAEAAFANGVLAHGLVREDMHAGAIAHLGVVVWPSLLALAQRKPVSGGDLVAAAVVGYEAGARIGRALVTAELARLFRPTGLVGPLAAALAGARLLDLDQEAATSALALAANTSGGLNQWPHGGGSEMYFHPGFAARSAVTAVELAERGAYASAEILEGEAGLFAAFARSPLAADIALFADGTEEILAVFNKPVPACNFAQTPCQAALLAVQALEGPSTRVRAVAIEASEAALRYPGCDARGPFARPLQAKMSIPFGVAAALARGAVAEDSYCSLEDGEIRRLIAVTSLRADPGFTAAFPARQGARVTLSLDDGREIARALPDVVFATPALVRERFRAAAGGLLGADRAGAIEALADGLEDAPDAGRIAALCASAAP